MWDIIKNWIFDGHPVLLQFCGDWGMAIIIVTVIFRITRGAAYAQAGEIVVSDAKGATPHAGDPAQVCRRSHEAARGNAKAVCGSKVQSAGWLLADDSADAYLHCFVPGVERNGATHRRNILRVL